MARGGQRFGAGRPKGAKTRKAVAPAATAALAADDPVEYLLAVMRDNTADQSRRDRAASALLPYLHSRQRLGDTWRGPRALALERARTAHEGSDWGDDLAPIEPRRVN